MVCPSDPPLLRRAACCDAEPKCVLCPLRPENARRPLSELWAAGLMPTDAVRGRGAPPLG